MPSPQDSEQHKPPHLKTPPYVHHFDTYGLVRDLHASSYTREQSTTLMKAVRGLLMSNMELARAGLVSKSNVENETYLFRAACSELKTEVGNARKGEIERMRAERAGLTHEVDILGQRLGQETGMLKDGLKGLFDDRKMGVRTEQRLMETKVRCVASRRHTPRTVPAWLQYASDANAPADPGTQLQNHSHAQLGRAQRGRRLALGADAARGHYRRRLGVHAVCRPAVHELRAASAAGGAQAAAAEARSGAAAGRGT
jgi:hypothetical protein